jgi:hypothetical protein
MKMKKEASQWRFQRNAGNPQEDSLPKNGDPTPSKILSQPISWIP